MSATQYDSISLSFVSQSVTSSQNIDVTAQLKMGTTPVNVSGVLIDLYVDNKIYAFKNSNSNGRAVWSIPASNFTIGTHLFKANVDQYPLIATKGWNVTISSAVQYDNLSLGVNSTTADPGGQFIFNAHLRLGTVQVAASGLRVNLGIDGALAGTGLTTSQGGIQFTVQASTLTIGTHNAVAYLDSEPNVFSTTKVISVLGNPTVGTVNLVINNPNLSDSNTPFTFAGSVQDTSGLPMQGQTITLGYKSGLTSTYLFNTQWATTGPGGTFAGSQMTGEGTYDFKAIASSVESNVVSGTRTIIQPPGTEQMTITRVSDGSAVTNANNVVGVNSTIRINIAGFSPSSATGVKLYDGDIEIQNITTDTFGAGTADLQLVSLGTHVIGVKDVVRVTEKIQIVDVQQIDNPPPPPPPPTGGGKTWYDMTLTEKAAAIAAGLIAAPILLKMTNIGSIAPARQYYAPRHKKPKVSRINTKELAKFIKKRLR